MGFAVYLIDISYDSDFYADDNSSDLNADYNSSDSFDSSLPDNYAVNVIDGDTFEIASGNIVRLLCVDAPELGKTGSEEAKQFLEGLVLDKEVRLEKDISETDDYGRLLRYVYVNISDQEVFVNKELVTEGYASVFRYGEDVKRCNEIEKEITD